MLLIYGIYRFRPQRIAFRNDHCLSCKRPRRAVQIRSFDALHLFWIPLLPLGFRKRWLCTACHRPPHAHPGTRRNFVWAGLVVLLFLAAVFWAFPITPDIFIPGWIIRVAAPVGAVLTAIYLTRSPKGPSLKRQLALIAPAADTTCPFCNSPLLVLSSQCSCPACGVLRV